MLTVGAPLAGCSALVREPIPFEPSPPDSVTSLTPLPAEVVALEAEPNIVKLRRPRPVVLPPRLPAGGTIGLIAPAGVLRSRGQLEDAIEAVEDLGFETKVGRHVLARYGFLAGTDAQRASDVMAMIQDPEVDAIVAVRGGWGCARILPLLDYDVIAAHPKPIVGYSDTTALLLAIYQRTGLVTFHGPVGVSSWNSVTAASFVQTLVEGDRVSGPMVSGSPSSFVQTLVEGDPLTIGPETRSNRDRTRTVTGGQAEGPVVGGNLTVISALAGTGYLPSFDGHVVFFEEVGEDAYRVDRMLIQLELAGQFEAPAGVAFGQCSSCGSGGSAWTAEEAIRRRLATYPCPSILGAPIGHVSPVYTLPVGLEARLDADAGTLEYASSAVA